VDEPRWAAANKDSDAGQCPNVEVLKNYQIVLPNGSYVPLSSLGDVRNGYEEPIGGATEWQTGGGFPGVA